VSSGIEKRPIVGLGDLIRAAVCLDASTEECARIAALLDLPRAEPAAAPPPSGRPRVTAPPLEQRSLSLPVDPVPQERRREAQELGKRFDTASAGSFELLGPTKSASPGPLVLEGLPPLGPSTVGVATEPHEPLFAPASTRNILAATLSIEEENGPIDAARLVDDVASCRTVTRLPREPSPTLRRGAFALIDRGETMEPFYRDVAEVLRSIEQVLGSDRLTRFTFDGTPKELSRWADGEPWTFAPPAGTPVVLISDLGLRRPSAEDEWLDFTRRAREIGCPLTALVPYPPARWPEQLAQRMRAVTWDRTTTVAAAWRAARRMGARP
jgi:hypothetical protein